MDPPYQSITSPLGVPALAGPVQVAGFLAIILTQIAVLVAGASLLVRFRRARGTERQQLRWVAFAAGCWRWRWWPPSSARSQDALP